jgi:predicted transcriptional regulator
MPVTTTLKLPEKLKKRIAPLAKSAGKSPHAWMLEAIEAEATRAEMRRRFIADALAAEKEMWRTGKAYAMEDVHSYLRATARGKPATRPRPVRP